MTDPITFDEWALDVTCAKTSGVIAFVPICGDEVVWGMTYIVLTTYATPASAAGSRLASQ